MYTKCLNILTFITATLMLDSNASLLKTTGDYDSQNMSLACVVSGESATVKWRRNGKLIEDNMNIIQGETKHLNMSGKYESTLYLITENKRIHELRHSLSGIFTCEVRNEHQGKQVLMNCECIFKIYVNVTYL